MASGLCDGNIKIWNKENWTLSKTLVGGGSQIESMAVLSGGELISCLDSGLYLRNTNTGVQSAGLPKISCRSITILKDRRLATAASDHAIYLEK